MSTIYYEYLVKSDGTQDCYKEIDAAQKTNEVITCAAKVAYEKALALDPKVEKPEDVTKWEANTELYWQHYKERLEQEARNRGAEWSVYCETTKKTEASA
jgi:hypothetical protein